MKERKNFDNEGSTKRRLKGKRFILSIVALVEIILILVVSTYAWVETVSTIKIYTGDNGNTTQTGQIYNHNLQMANISNSSTAAIDLSQMIHQAGDFHLAPASSADGKNIFFPAAKGQTTNYRAATSSDNMVNYISLSFKVSQAGMYVFNADPTFAFDGTANTSALVRFSLTAGNDTRIFARTASTTAVVANTSGTTAATNARNTTYYRGTGAYPASYYALKTTSANQIVTLKMWIQDPTFASTATYLGKKFTVSALRLVPAYEVKATVSVNGTAATTNSTVGTVKVGSGTASYTASALYKYNTSTTAASVTATLSDSANYSFVGWGTTANATSYSSTNNPYSFAVTGSKTLYAIFKQKYTISAQVALGTTPATVTTYGTVKVGSNTAGATSSGTYSSGESVTLTATVTSNYAIIGWYKNSLTAANFVADSNGKTSISVTANANDKYYVSYKQKATTTIYMTYRGYSKMRVYVYGKSTNQHYLGDFKAAGNKPTYTGTRGLYSISFTTGEDEDIGIIVYDYDDSDNSRSEYTARIGETILVGPSGSSINRSFSLGNQRYVYFTKKWPTNKIHYWGGSLGNSTWNSRPTMTNVAYTNSYNEQILYYVINTGNTYVIFDNGSGTQTKDTPLGSNSCFYFSSAGAEAGTWAPSTS